MAEYLGKKKRKEREKDNLINESSLHISLLCISVNDDHRNRFDGKNAAACGLIHDTCPTSETLSERGIAKGITLVPSQPFKSFFPCPKDEINKKFEFRAYSSQLADRFFEFKLPTV